MKRVFLLFALFLVIVPLFAATLVKVDEVDDFGDPTGEFYLTFDQDLSGTFKNSSTNGSLKWNIVIDLENGWFRFMLKENGMDVDVTTSSRSSACVDADAFYVVLFKNTIDGSIETLYGELETTETYKINAISLCSGYFRFDCREFFSGDESFKVVIKSDYGSYSLGILDMNGFSGLVYDYSPYGYGIQLMEAGKYQEALDVFEKYKANDAISYAHFKTNEQVEKCRIALLDDYPYLKGIQLMEAGKYQEALDVFEEYEINDEASYVHFETDVQVDKSRKALGLYYVGDIGPSGGYVFYDCDADNGSGNADGLVSSECGWRYLEAAPSDLMVVGGKPTVDATESGYDNAGSGYIFGYCRASASGDNQLVGTDTSIGTGKSNTEKLVDSMGTSAYTSYYSSDSGTTGDYAARLCSILEYGVYDDWFLPSNDELKLMYENLYKKGIGSCVGYGYWSSSESSAYHAWGQYFFDGDQLDHARSNVNCVRPIRAF